ncbi:response regulator [Sporolactobacillus spathodeae]|uniref:CheY-like chemotaxis protein n=1 Tax=Sporolactobacillus spathodeae TaxID=1465502 RepID=A0ABS2Q7S9_9BACL|nr:response regulator [Sporolactobacillus spathodeae]MBM7657495.1 CheY-like chemotaxis protein [Sporolactobacillus spathodeae]
MMNILIVDDSRFSQKVTSGLIKQFIPDAVQHFADDGLEGLEKYKEIKPDFMIIDLLMPKLRGQDLIEEVKKIDIDAKIIVLSADVQHKVREVIDKMGVLTFINKPLNEEKAKTIANLIRNDAQ